MFKFAVLSVLLAAVAAEPGYYFPAPLTYTSTYIAPATTTISKQASSVVHPSPVYTSAFPYAHFIKKRSAPLLSAPGYITPYYAHSYVAPTYFAKPLAYSYPTPYVHYAAPYAPVAAHLIKKRSAPVVTSYITPTSYIPTTYTTAPYYPTAYTTPYYTAPYYASAYSPFYIKK